MNAAEHVVKLWLESQNFFVLGPLHATRGNFEIDLLCVRLSQDTKEVAQRVHVEVTVSSRPAGKMETAETYIARKFEALRYFVQPRLGQDYERWVVIGKLSGGEALWSKDCEDRGVKVVPFARVISEYITSQKNTPADQLGRLLDSLKQWGLLTLPPAPQL